MIEIALAFAAGVLTVVSPCILPIHPILLSASIGQRSHSRSLFSRGAARRHRLLHAIRHGRHRVAFGFLPKPPDRIMTMRTSSTKLFASACARAKLYFSLSQSLARLRCSGSEGLRLVRSRTGAGIYRNFRLAEFSTSHDGKFERKGGSCPVLDLLLHQLLAHAALRDEVVRDIQGQGFHCHRRRSHARVRLREGAQATSKPQSSASGSPIRSHRIISSAPGKPIGTTYLARGVPH
jgi:hypothetical protein